MDSEKNELEPMASDSSPQGTDQTSSIEQLEPSGKLLAIVFDGYVKLYTNVGVQLAIATVADVSQLCSDNHLSAERIALELAELQIPKGWQFLSDERLLVGTIATRVPTIDDVHRAEIMRYGITVISQAVQRSNQQRRAS